jgi:hypothetical protein
LDLKEEEVTGDWRKLHNEELCDTDSLTSIEEIKTRRMRRVECVACFVFSSWHRCCNPHRYFSWFSSFLPVRNTPIIMLKILGTMVQNVVD